VVKMKRRQSVGALFHPILSSIFQHEHPSLSA
jgi:hypothetical protein